MTLSPRKRGAPPGNRNAAKLATGPEGLRFNIYLNSAQVATLDEAIWQRDHCAPTDETRRALARELLSRALADVRQSQDRDEGAIVL